MAVPCRAGRQLPSIIGCCLLVILVLLGIAAMHSGASATTSTGSHSTPHSVPMTGAEPGRTATIAVDTREPLEIAIVSATIAAGGSTTSSLAHGLVAGCVLALTGAVGLVLARLLARSVDGRPWRVISFHDTRRTIRVPGSGAPPPRARFALCVLRT